MKKYKLIKQYLGCPYELNQEIDADFMWVDFKKVHLKDYPENWEEVVEKDYEILSFKQNSKIDDLWEAVDIDCSKFSRKSGQMFCTSPYTLKQILHHPLYFINSVKRLSDGEIFSVGDEISCKGYNNTTISKISIIHNDLCLWGNYVNNMLGYISLKDDIQHIKKPLFTTEDGVEMFEGDIYCYLHKHSFFIDRAKAHKPFIDADTTGLRFSTKEAAKEYVLMNKPCLSINDVFKVYPKFKKKSHLLTNHAEKLISLAKSKL